jgi:predicted transcriptional regulator
MSTKQSRQYLSLLTSKDLVHIQRAAGKVTYQRTEAGGEFLKQYDKMAMLFGPSVSAPSLT